MRVAYVDMVGGAAGDMLMAAFVDAGLDPAVLERALRTIVPGGWKLTTERVDRRGIAATYLDLDIPGEDHHAHDEHGHHPPPPPRPHPHDHAHPHDHPHPHDHGHGHDHGDHGHDGHGHDHAHEPGGRRLRDILALVARSGMTPRQIERASAVYRRIAEAEARIHGQTAETVVFHEVGQIDAILDVAGTCIALDLLEIDELRCSAFPAGHGVAKMAHGMYPNPSPATAELLRGQPLRMVDVRAELVTVTGAAILTTLAVMPGQRVDMTLEKIGYGAGRSDFPFPNVVRVLIGTVTSPAPLRDEVVVLDANIDDMSPQNYELAIERLFAAGALDVWMTPVVMKKGRPAVTLSAIADPSHEAAVAQTMLRETTTIGVRVRRELRYILARDTAPVETPYGPVRVKSTSIGGGVRHRPEYDDCVRIARERALPLAEVLRVVERCLDATVGT